MPVISIIIPTYRRPKSLRKAIKSILNQTFSDLEILVVNDDKEDEQVRTVIKAFKDKRIRYLRNNRTKGGNGARNTGILESTGRYITFLDDDDEFETERIRKVIDFLEVGSQEAVATGYRVNSKRAPHPAFQFTLENYLLRKVTLGSGSNIVLNREKIERKDLMWDEDLFRHQDVEYLIRLLSKYSFGYLPEYLLRVNGHNGRPKAEKIQVAKKILFSKIESSIKAVDISVKNQFYAFQYLEMAKVYGLEGNNVKMVNFLNRSFDHGIVEHKMYGRIPILYFRNIIKKSRNKF